MTGVYASQKPLVAPSDQDSILGFVGGKVRRFSIADMRGLPGVQGPAGADGAKWQFGSGAPSLEVGADGDSYLDTSNGDVYQRASGAWSYVSTLKGSQGPAGPQGPSGDGGSFTLGATATELAPSATGGLWTLSGTGMSQNGTGIHFSGAANVAAASFPVASLKDNTTYDVTFTVANYVGGMVRVMVYGATTGHLGATNSVSANGTYTVQVTTSSAGTNTKEIRIQATGTSGTNTFDVTSVSVKEAATNYPTRTMAAKVKEAQISVIDFGADPTGVADSTAAFNAAIAYGARRIRVPMGTYKVTKLVIDKSVEIYGDGREQTIIQVTGSGAIHGMQIIGDAALGKSNLITLREFQLRYTGAGQTAAGGGPGLNNWSGIYIQRKVDMRHVYVRGFTNDGIYFAPSDADEATGTAGTKSNAVFFAELSQVWSKENGRDGIAIRAGANANVFTNCQFDKNKRYGLHHYTDGQPTYGNRIRDGQASYNSYQGYYFENGTNLVTSGLYTEFNGSPTNSNTDGYQNTTIDVHIGDDCVDSHFEVGTLLNRNTARVRLPAFNSNTIQVWTGGKRLFGDT